MVTSMFYNLLSVKVLQHWTTLMCRQFERSEADRTRAMIYSLSQNLPDLHSETSCAMSSLA